MLLRENFTDLEAQNTLLIEGSATGWKSRTNFERNPGIRGQNPLIHPRKTTNPLIFIPGIQESRTLFHAVADPSLLIDAFSMLLL